MKYQKLFYTLFALIIVCLLFTGCDTEEKEDIKADYSWKCGESTWREDTLETQIIGIGTKENADFELEPGKYEIKYTYIESDQPRMTNRTYIISITDSYVEDIENYDSPNFYMFQAPDVEDIKEIEVKAGQYIYVQHTANDKAKGGNIYLIKK